MEKYKPRAGAWRPKWISNQICKEFHFGQTGPDRVTKFKPRDPNGKTWAKDWSLEAKVDFQTDL